VQQAAVLTKQPKRWKEILSCSVPAAPNVLPPEFAAAAATAAAAAAVSNAAAASIQDAMCCSSCESCSCCRTDVAARDPGDAVIATFAVLIQKPTRKDARSGTWLMVPGC
jgi:hypothetical protein